MSQKESEESVIRSLYIEKKFKRIQNGGEMTLNLHIREEERYRGSLLPKDKAQRPKARLHAMNDIVENELFDDKDDDFGEDDNIL